MKIFKQKSDMIKKMWLNQFAFSLFGLFVATPFSGKTAVIAGIFSLLFYYSVMCYAIIDDAQRDSIKVKAGRGDGCNIITGLKYSVFAFVPTFVLAIVSSVLSLTGVKAAILTIIIRYALCGEVLGIYSGLANYVMGENGVAVSHASKEVLFFADNGLIQLIFVVLSAFVFGLIYYLAYTGKIKLNTVDKNEMTR